MKLPKWLRWFNRVPGGVFEHPVPEPQTPEPAAVEKKALVTYETTKREFDDETGDLLKFRKYIQGIACPMCGAAKMDLTAYEKGVDGWEAVVTCSSCFVKGVFNEGGFRIVKAIERHVRD